MPGRNFIFPDTITRPTWQAAHEKNTRSIVPGLPKPGRSRLPVLLVVRRSQLGDQQARVLEDAPRQQPCVVDAPSRRPTAARTCAGSRTRIRTAAATGARRPGAPRRRRSRTGRADADVIERPRRRTLRIPPARSPRASRCARWRAASGSGSFGSRSRIVLNSTNGTPLNPTGLLRNQLQASRGFWPLRKPYFSARTGSASSRYPSMARSRFAISAAQSVTTCPSTHDTISSLVSSFSGATSPPASSGSRVSVSSLDVPRPHAPHERRRNSGNAHESDSLSASSHITSAAPAEPQARTIASSRNRRTAAKTSLRRGSDRRAAAARSAARTGTPARRLAARAAQILEPEQRATIDLDDDHGRDVLTETCVATPSVLQVVLAWPVEDERIRFGMSLIADPCAAKTSVPAEIGRLSAMRAPSRAHLRSSTSPCG